MASHIGVFLFVFLLYLSYFNCDSRDMITPGNLLSNGETLVSAGDIFELGFFNPASSNNGEFNNYYVGIWYKVSPETVVWVANRDNPIPFSSAEPMVIAIDDDGNLKVWDSTGKSYFSTEVVTGASSAKLMDSGNLVLIDDLSGKQLWQSFDEPTDTFLPGMRMDDGFKLTAWRITQKDPSTGNYTFGLKQAGNSEYTILQKTVIHWKRSARAGYSNPRSFNELPSTVAYMLSNFNKEFALSNFNYTRLLMNSSGEIQLCIWDDNSRGWFVLWSEPEGPCGVYDTCGKFGICDRENISSMCKCLPGFNPTSPDDWMAGNFIHGCSRKSVTTCKKKSEFDTFLIMSSMKFDEPDLQYSEAKTEYDCRKECVGNCQCVAYSYEHYEAQRRSSSPKTVSAARCSIWINDLHNLQDNYEGGFNLSVRVAMSDIAANNFASLHETFDKGKNIQSNKEKLQALRPKLYTLSIKQ